MSFIPLIESLNDLVNLCKVQKHAPIDPWLIDSWTLKKKEIEALAKVFHTSTGISSVKQEVKAKLQIAGVDLDTLLLDDRWKDKTLSNDSERKQKNQFDRVTRADLIEWAAVATIVSEEGISFDNLVLPNALKSSRTISKRGLDLLTFVLDPDHEDEDTLGENERIIIGSVKHTIKEKDGSVDSYDVCYKLINSLNGKELNRSYLTGQLRLLQAQMEKDSRSFSRIYLVLANELAEKHLDLMAFGAVNIDGDTELREKLESMLPKAKVTYCRLRHFRQLFVEDLDQLHLAVV